MTWRDKLIDANLQPCSFRGVEMMWDSNRMSGGRSLTVHRYPKRAKVEVEDLSPTERRFSLDACVIGRDYAAQRDKLIKALDVPGAGLLVHPHYGQVNVCVETFEVEHTTQSSGYAAFRISFIRDDGTASPGAVVDTQAAAATQADAAFGASATQFADTYTLPDSFARETALARANALLKAAAAKVASGYAFGDLQMQRLQTALLDPVLGARTLLQDVIDLPAELSYRLQSMIVGAQNATSLRALFALYSGNDINTSTKPVASLDTLALQSVAIAISQQIASVDYASYDEAQAALDIATAALDDVSYAADDDTYAALQDLRAALATDINTRAANLARITAYTPKQTLPALVIAHRLYGIDALTDNADDIVARNGIVHPGFVPGGQSLEVLTP